MKKKTILTNKNRNDGYDNLKTFLTILAGCFL